MKKNILAVLGLALCLGSFSSDAAAQSLGPAWSRGFARRPITLAPRVGVAPAPAAAPAPGRIAIRGIPYEDHSRSTRLSSTVVRRGAFFQIQSTTLRFRAGQDVRVVLEDVNSPSGLGVTVFRLTNVRASGGTITAQAPNLALFANRTFHVTVFVFERGQPNRYAAPGRLTIR